VFRDSRTHETRKFPHLFPTKAAFTHISVLSGYRQSSAPLPSTIPPPNLSRIRTPILRRPQRSPGLGLHHSTLAVVVRISCGVVRTEGRSAPVGLEGTGQQDCRSRRARPRLLSSNPFIYSSISTTRPIILPCSSRNPSTRCLPTRSFPLRCYRSHNRLHAHSPLSATRSPRSTFSRRPRRTTTRALVHHLGQHRFSLFALGICDFEYRNPSRSSWSRYHQVG